MSTTNISRLPATAILAADTKPPLSLADAADTWSVTSYWLPAILTTCIVVSFALVYQRRRRQQRPKPQVPTGNDVTTADTGRPVGGDSDVTAASVDGVVDDGQLRRTVPESVNYHFTRQCNYNCGFCFHTAKTSYLLPLEEAQRGLKLLKEAGMKKINFSGGEPFLPGRDGDYLGEMVKYCKRDLGVESVSIVSNGSLIKETWFGKYGEYLDILAISCDSFSPETNRAIGRQFKSRDHVVSMRRVRQWCLDYKVAFKMNTVVNSYNKDEDLTEEIRELNPCRWKVFQCLVIDGENAGEDAKRNAERFQVTDEDFDAFIARHSSISCLVRENNDEMRRSYLILDEYMRFLDGATKQPSLSILDVGVQAGMDAANFDEQMFLKRGGKYKWSKEAMKLDW